MGGLPAAVAGVGIEAEAVVEVAEAVVEDEAAAGCGAAWGIPGI